MSAPWKRFISYYTAGDEGLDKKDDDRRPTPHHGLPKPGGGPWLPARPGQRRTAKRLVIWALVVAGVYYFFTRLPSGLDFGDDDGRLPPEYPRDPRDYDYDYDVVQPIKIPTVPALAPAALKPPKPDKGKEPVPAPADRSYTGAVKFYNLADSLHAIATTRGTMERNKNVLFAASSLKSAAALLPLACQMGMELRSYVHFALMSRSELAIEDLKKVNGIHGECEIIFHGRAVACVAANSG